MLTPARRIAVVAPIMVRYDAISLAARDMVRALSADPCLQVRHFGGACEFPEVEHRTCHDVASLLLDPEYQAADAAVFHFGMHNSLFDALLAGGPPVRVVRFHNVTPARLVAPADRPAIERSLTQIHTLRHADEIWADSHVNAQALREYGVDPATIEVIPLVVEDPVPARLADKPATPIELLYIGRIAPSKGIHDLLAAMALLDLPPGAIRLTIAGNTAWSDPAYLHRLQDLIDREDLAGMVRFAGTVADAERDRLFHAAHVLVVPSYHEGFCRPVAEGLRAGCIPLVYDAYNLPHIAAGLGRVVPPGDIDALADGLSQLNRALALALPARDDAVLPLDRGLTSVREFDTLAAAYLGRFSADVIGRAVRSRLSALLCAHNMAESGPPAAGGS